MNLKQTRLHILDKAKDLSKEAKTGVSLHCHTEHSKEMLDFVPYYAAKIPIISYFWEKECLSYFGREGKEPNFWMKMTFALKLAKDFRPRCRVLRENRAATEEITFLGLLQIIEKSF